jgi:hypothetical protein
LTSHGAHRLGADSARVSRAFGKCWIVGVSVFVVFAFVAFVTNFD